ncbi:zinc-binding dehydrogenase [Sulfobacillus harzensis]|uniref:Zinc-binding dehydrogenase n=1 Tax=Sulfobacillus harzensis TaxID=2729629 RepID=A0A7Y0L4L6_9FIRM|nr:zinc-binding dehydrogenase [Sulfobacillus harzensis]NMP21774.1 zinc-binding dehydrogenase [Sulfobacillus harzensis]
MKAIRIHEPGDIRVLRYEEVDIPEPGVGEVRVRLRAAGVNHRDIWVRQGNFGPMAEPVIPGSDGAGEVDAIGAGVRRWSVGQKVVINPGLACGTCSACLSGDHPACQSFSIYNGTYAEYAVVPEENVVSMPGGLTFAEAASIGVPYVTAEDFLMRSRALPGQTLLLWGATGGLGVATLQLAKLRGMRVIAVTRNAARSEKLRQYGADEVAVIGGEKTVVETVSALTGGQGADIVVDSVGQASFPQSLDAVRRGGVIVTVGSTTGGQVSFELGQLFRSRITLLGAFMGSGSILPRILPLFSRGVLVPVIDSTYPLEQADQAHEQMENHGVFGKIILTM